MDKWTGQQALEGWVAAWGLGGWEGSGRLGEWRTGRLSAGLSGNEPVDVTETSVLLHSLWTCFTSPPWGDIQ